MKTNQYTLISIEGNIGSGKSTLLKLIQQKYPDLRFIPEPVNEWQCINGDPSMNLLGSFYEDPTRWAYTMQVYAFYSRLKHWKEVLSDPINPEEKHLILSERSIEADKEIFAVNGHKNGLINNLEFALYEKFYDWLCEEVFGKKIQKQMIIYLQVDPEVCHLRMQKRARDEEKNTISKEYLTQIHNRHEEWLLRETHKNTSILVLNGDKEFESDLNQQQKMFNSIDNFLKGLL
ncbi:unnamed protein product [Paramecium pentaurelia]|uniref:Deoxynucleoside kinase domain-containing protein n=1 Tax=Paramecium pentaurelia TaxID=43138 RepID=A0A8S1W1T0_9CILI|nr:unnamed protein product [Paramecium pentaurelia]